MPGPQGPASRRPTPFSEAPRPPLVTRRAMHRRVARPDRVEAAIRLRPRGARERSGPRGSSEGYVGWGPHAMTWGRHAAHGREGAYGPSAATASASPFRKSGSRSVEVSKRRSLSPSKGPPKARHGVTGTDCFEAAIPVAAEGRAYPAGPSARRAQVNCVGCEAPLKTTWGGGPAPLRGDAMRPTDVKARPAPRPQPRRRRRPPGRHG